MGNRAIVNGSSAVLNPNSLIALLRMIRYGSNLVITDSPRFVEILRDLFGMHGEKPGAGKRVDITIVYQGEEILEDPNIRVISVPSIDPFYRLTTTSVETYVAISMGTRGGVGKTTMSLLLLYLAARKVGIESIAILDGDPNGTLSRVLASLPDFSGDSRGGPYSLRHSVMDRPIRGAGAVNVFAVTHSLYESPSPSGYAQLRTILTSLVSYLPANMWIIDMPADMAVSMELFDGLLRVLPPRSKVLVTIGAFPISEQMESFAQYARGIRDHLSGSGLSHLVLGFFPFFADNQSVSNATAYLRDKHAGVFDAVFKLPKIPANMWDFSASFWRERANISGLMHRHFQEVARHNNLDSLFII